MSGAIVCIAAVHPLAHLNAALNLLATGLLLLALWHVRRGRLQAHGRTMVAALCASAAFLTSYLIYHAKVGHVPFTHGGAAKIIYRLVLWTHIPLAFTVPFLAIIAAIWGAKSLGWGAAAALASGDRDRYRLRHRRLVRWAYPVWLYVSISGVAVYVMLYHIWPAAEP